jgi:hypothetical protein
MPRAVRGKQGGRKPTGAPPHVSRPPAKQAVERFAKLVALLKEHPGRTAIELQHLGWRPETDGELEEAEKAGLIVWVRQKWFAV